MKEKLNKALGKFKAFWGGLTKKIKILLCAGLGAILIGAVILTVVLNSSDGWVVLFPGMTTDESAEVYLELENMQVETRINSDHEIEVKEEQWDELVYKLAEKGYPQSTPSYGTFFNNLSMTMSEFEKKETLRFELQDRIQTTLKRIDGVKGALVNINIPEQKQYAWEENTEKATASVLLTLDRNADFNAEQVSAVKNIVAYSAQQVLPDDVSVVDAATGLEMKGLEDAPTDIFDDESRINYKNIIKNQYEENARRILAPIYGEDGVIAVASVEVDYDKINEEVKEFITNEDGEGVKQSQHIKYDTDGVVDPGGIVGEEDNTDIPNYGNLEDELNSDNTPEYERDTEWAIGYILRQTEKAQGGITDASISVVVTTESGVLTAAETENVIQLVRNATNIDIEKISAGARLADSLELPGEDPIFPSDSPLSNLLNSKWFKWLLLAAGILLLAIILLIILLINKRAKRRIALAQAESQAQIDNMKRSIEEQDNMRKSIEEAAKEHNDSDNATANEVKDFAKKNPEIAAALIRSMMKE